MFNDSVSFNGGTRVEVITVLANCGRDTDKARRALVTWIRHKQDKGRSTEHILVKLRDIESKFIKDTSLHSAFRDARAETFLPRPPDIPLPSPIKRRSEGRAPESMASPSSAVPSWLSSPSLELPMDLRRQSSSPVSPLFSLSDSPRVLEISRESLNVSRRGSIPRGVPHNPHSASPRIQIPSRKSLQPPPSSPITSSPEDSGMHFRHRYMSQPVGSTSQPTCQVPLPSAGSPDSPSQPTSARDRNQVRSLFRGVVPPVPLPPIQIPRSRAQRSYPNSPRTPSSEETDSHPRYHHISGGRKSISPGHSRVTPPRTSPPGVPLPPIPSSEQDSDSNSGFEQNLPAQEPPTPVRSTIFTPLTPARPLPIQPVPSPVPGSDESESVDTLGGDSLREHWQEPNAGLPLEDIVRQDSPVYVFGDDPGAETGSGAPPPYIGQIDSYFEPDVVTFGEGLDRAVSVCGGSQEVRVEVSRCIGCYRGYEPPYWQTRLQACGLNAEAARYLVDEMSKHVDWAASFGRAR